MIGSIFRKLLIVLCAGKREMSDPRSRGSEKAEMLQIRAVYYEPRPVGLEPHEFGKSPAEEHVRNILRLSVLTDCKVRLSPDSDNDLYTSAFRNMHQRDLYIMRSLGENTPVGGKQ